MLTDNFPFKSYANTLGDGFNTESIRLSSKCIDKLNHIAQFKQVEPESIIFALFSIYLFKYMDDDIVSTLCLTEAGSRLLRLPLNPQQSVARVASIVDKFPANTSSYFDDNSTLAIRVRTGSDGSDDGIETKYPFLLDIDLGRVSSEIRLFHPDGVLADGAAELIVRQIFELVQDVSSIIDTEIQSLSLVTSEIKEKILNDFKIQEEIFNYRYGIYARFVDQVNSTPDTEAIIFLEKRLTYSQLNTEVDALAQILHHAGAKRGNRVAVFLERSDRSIISILAILKLGCTYIPLDSSYPNKYIENIQRETKFGFAITQSSLQEHLDGIECCIIDVAQRPNETLDRIVDIPIAQVEPKDEFAILYTSGTTGQPKGAIYNHSSPLNKFCWMWSFFKFDEDDVFLQRTSVSFSPSLWELFGALLIGRKTVIVPDSIVKDPRLLIQTIDAENVTFMGVVPALLRMMFSVDEQLLSSLGKLRYISCSGEPMQIDLYQKIRHVLSDVRLFNDYGSTEMNAVGYSEITEQSTKSKNFPIGKPISNVHYYILDSNLDLVPPFMTGNLYVGGTSLLNGYVGGKDVPFIEDPIRKSEVQYFKSGDKARFLSDGKIELVGRDDFVVKIRGMRVSLYQVETAIKSCPGVSDACVVSRKRENGENEMIAYLSSSESILEVRAFCHSALPQYMVPAKFILYGELPKKTNGKLDRKYLSDLAVEQCRQNASEMPDKADVKAALMVLASNIFLDDPSNADCAFSDLGMSSMDAVEFVAKICDLWSLKLPVTTLLQFDSIDPLARYIEAVLSDDVFEITPREDLWKEVSKHGRINQLPCDKLTNAVPKNVLVTGANGFLGSCLVSKLLKQAELVVFCLIRAKSQEEAENKISHSLRRYGIEPKLFKDRLKVVAGNITDANLGLKNSDYTDLANNVDSVFHLAANTNHFSNYNSLYSINVLGTRNIIDFCLFGKEKKLVFSSTVSVLLKKDGDHYYSEDAETLVSPDGLYNGYGKTKWVSEQLVDDANKIGLQTSIVRLGELSFDSETGFHREDDIFHSCLKLMSNLALCPTWSEGRIGGLAVDKVAAAFIEILNRMKGGDNDPARVINMISPVYVEVQEVFLDRKQIQFGDWVEAAKTHICENQDQYPPAFSAFFENGESALITEYFKKVEPVMKSFNTMMGDGSLKTLALSSGDFRKFIHK
ncbi:putative bacitracin synthetase 1 (BA1) [Rhodobacteraceae bacterium KLH11]|nr:putative bacitracin synthetase 1 (BA1) [Rhodobacteraceae bacterium KLH11]